VVTQRGVHEHELKSSRAVQGPLISAQNGGGVSIKSWTLASIAAQD
jgi:hypothetical protein